MIMSIRTRAQDNETMERIMEHTIIRNSRKKRITRNTRSTRTMRKPRTSRVKVKLKPPSASRCVTHSSATEYTARSASNMFHFQSSSKKKPTRFAARRSNTSTTKNKTKLKLIARNHSGSRPGGCFKAFRTLTSVCTPMKTALQTMTAPHNEWKVGPPTICSSMWPRCTGFACKDGSVLDLRRSRSWERKPKSPEIVRAR
mmetsp:Transcript_101497/g.310374  ORF Transcript_101497/g.310374 Transcript_101497/m.310374 type:complete len:200 (-) Transcript_101497:253-852(-)